MESSRRRFHTRATPPGGRRMRRNSARDSATENQWKAWPAATTSTEADARPVASARPGTARKRPVGPSQDCATAAMAALGSTP